MRPKGAKKQSRRARSSSSTPTGSSRLAEPRTTSGPSTSRRSSRTVENYEEVPAYSCIVPVERILEENDANLNIRRYADNTPPPEPQDVRAHLVGGVPKTEVEALKSLCMAHGFDPNRIFKKRDAHYFDFKGSIADKAALQEVIQGDPGVRAKEQELRGTFDAWWDKATKRLATLPQQHDSMKVREKLLATFVEDLEPVSILDRFKLTGALVTWWQDQANDLKTLEALGFEGLIDSWVESVRYLVEDPEARKDKSLDPMNYPLIRHLLPDFLREIEGSEAKVAELEVRKEAFESGEEAEEGEWEPDEENNDYAKYLENRLKELKDVKRGNRSQEALYQKELDAIDATLGSYKSTKKELTEAKKELKQVKGALFERLEVARQNLNELGGRKLVLAIFRETLDASLDAYVGAHLRQMIGALENLTSKYRVHLGTITKKHHEDSAAFSNTLTRLGYGRP